MKVMAIVLAAGQGKRMKSKLYKVLHPVCGKPMVGHVLQTVKEASCERTVVVVGHGAEAVQSFIGDGAEFVLQEQQLGTGHAVQQAEPLLGEEDRYDRYLVWRYAACDSGNHSSAAGAAYN